MIVSYAWRLVSRNGRRTGTYLFGLTLAVGLFAGILFFVDATARQMTATALAPVKLDLVAHATAPDVNMVAVAQGLAQQRGLTTVEPVTAADFVSAQKVGAAHGSPAGRLFAIRPAYLQQFDLLQLSAGTWNAQGAAISEAMATAQQLKVGDMLQLTFTGVAPPLVLPISAIVNLDGADALFATATEAENARVADVVFVDSRWFRTALQTPLAALAANPPLTLPPGTVVFDPQLHIKIDRAALPADPTLAALHTESLRREIERAFPGQIKAVDNLSQRFKTVRADVLSAKILFIFLGLPGVVLAAYLAKFAAELFAEAQRRELGLLRTRGATPAQITGILALAALLLAVGGSLGGLLVGAVALGVAARGSLAGALNPLAPGFDWGLFAGSAGLAFAAGLVLTSLAAFLPTFAALRREIVQERRTVRRTEPVPFWKRAYLDFFCLALAGIVLTVTQLNGGFKPSATEAAAVTLSFYIFLAPLLAWIGLTLLLLRLLERGLSGAASRLAGLFRRVLGEVGEVAGKSVSRRARQIGAATTVIALTLSFGISLAFFQQTYSNEKRLDAQYVVGADMRFTPALNTPQTADFAAQLHQPGVRGVTAVVRDTQALVGSEKNTVYGIDVPSFRQVAYLPDSFFVDGAAAQTVDAMTNRTTNYAPGSAQQVLDTLARTPNGVIISVEQAEKYNIRLGDPVRLRLYNRTTRKYTDVQTQAVGLFVYFPTSSQDSDFILNRAFMTAQSGDSAMDYFLLKTDPAAGTVTRVATALTTQYKNRLPVRIQTIETVVKADESSLAALNLEGLGAMERLYTILVTSVGLGIFLVAMINERRREFGAMRALGANLAQLRRFLLAEALTIGTLSLLLGGIVGVVLARLLVLLLGVIFTIPATGLAWPGGALATLVGLVVGGMILSTLLSARRLATLRVVEALRET
ncbi:MAG: FtsX-like permease family protein [Chloroflexota bacterium]|nr:FtsX-like permease family protein [Chloroflexota bacterium]